MTEADVEGILRRAHETVPDARPRIIADNGPQFIARDLKAFVRELGMTHVRTAPYDPRSSTATTTCACTAPGGDDKTARSRCGLDLLPEPEEELLALRYAATSRVAFTLNQYTRSEVRGPEYGAGRATAAAWIRCR